MGPTPGPPPPCGMQKVLCRLRWQTSAPMRPGEVRPDLGVHVGAVHVDLAAVLRGRCAQMSLIAALEDAVGRRVGDHERREVRRVLRGLGAAGRRGRRCPARRTRPARPGCRPWRRWRGWCRAPGGDEADVAVALAARLVVGADGEQAGVLALGAGVRLQGDGGEARDLREPGLEVARRAAGSRRSAPRARTDGAGRTPATRPGSISLAALSFIVHEPSGIIEWQSDRSRASSRLM